MKPILFNTQMVQAILDGRKTTTRRIIKIPSHIRIQENGLYTIFADGTCYENRAFEYAIDYIKKPYKVGDILYVRETWQLTNPFGDYALGNRTAEYKYRAGYGTVGIRTSITKEDDKKLGIWKPSIHMPKIAARIFLKVTDVRVERLQDITEDGIINEGTSYDEEIYKMPCNLKCAGESYLRGQFSKLWDSTVNKKDKDKYSWKANPWVWVMQFEVMEVKS